MKTCRRIGVSAHLSALIRIPPCATLPSLIKVDLSMHRSVSLLLALVLLTGCGSRRHHRERGAAPSGPRQTTIQFLGRGCFRLTSSVGLTVLIDPYNPSKTSSAVKAGSVPADVVFVTHEDETANFTDMASGSPQIFRSTMAVGVNRASGLAVRGIRTSSDKVGGDTSRLNIAFVWSMDGIRYCHLGAIADPVNLSESINIGNVDVLFMPIGGGFDEAKQRITLERLRPKIVIPISYSGGVGGGSFRMPTAHVRSTFTLAREQLPTTPTIYVP
jgi:Beta-lactamase superfamily domain